MSEREQAQQALKAIVEGIQTLALMNLPITIGDAYQVIERFLPEDTEQSSWEYDGYTTSARDGIRGDDAKACDVSSMKIGLGGGCFWFEIEGGFSDVANDAAVNIFVNEARA